jgi:hypothetical protein
LVRERLADQPRAFEIERGDLLDWNCAISDLAPKRFGRLPVNTAIQQTPRFNKDMIAQKGTSKAFQ